MAHVKVVDDTSVHDATQSPAFSGVARGAEKSKMRTVYVQINAQLDKVDFRNRHFEVDAFVKLFFLHPFKEMGPLKYWCYAEGRHAALLTQPGFHRNSEVITKGLPPERPRLASSRLVAPDSYHLTCARYMTMMASSSLCRS
mmetsp:Transcript_9946/g.25637  ORF Transcript_9946/g.25637 Transcript_9946/m.25637 type:complete len:142 (-) Transcript_9946:641-1066(-)